MEWVAVAWAALDVRGVWDGDEEADLIVIPVGQYEPIGLAGQYADLWLRLVDGPVPAAALTSGEQALMREYSAAGLASDDDGHAQRVRSVRPPWLRSLFHELVYALISRLAAQHSVDLVFIKGPVLQRQGLRPARHSGDVDVWVEPGRIMELADLLETAGWRHLNDKWEHSPLYHSVTMVPGAWGCEIDLHRHFPGFAASEDDLYAALRRNSETVEFAGVSVTVPNPSAHAVISALHHTRPEPGRLLPAGNERLAVRALVAAGPAALAFSAETGAGPALRGVLERAFPSRDVPVQGDLPLNWKWRTEPDRLKRYLIIFRGTPLWSWPLMAYRSLWPNAGMALRIESSYGVSKISPLSARFRRLKRGIVQQVRAPKNPRSG